MNKDVALVASKALDSEDSLSTQAGGYVAATGIGALALAAVPFISTPTAAVVAVLVGGGIWVKGKLK